ncbi:unnamed protein product, partial [Discosporangium mesarthrocarpum]
GVGHEDCGRGEGDAGFGIGLEAGVPGDFSPQFKFSFTDDIQMDLGGGLKDELRDLDNLQDFLGKSKASGSPTSSSLSSRIQLLSRGGAAVKAVEAVPARCRVSLPGPGSSR